MSDLSSSERANKKHASLWAAFDDALEPEGFGVEGYEVLGELARGGMGAVYHAKQLKPEREVALKVMLPKYASDPEMRERFQREARAMATLDHEGILPIYEVGESNGLPFFSMKLVMGGTLVERIKSPAEPQQAVEWMCQIASAVHHAHQHGVLHRDLKPGNLLLDQQGRVYVGDFGVAKMLRTEDVSHTQTQTFIGTPHYMPPEVASGSVAEATVKGDLYSLGAVFYECLAGYPPHHDHENVASLLRAIVDVEIRPIRLKEAGLPADLEVICRKALEKNPDARYESVAAFGEDLQRWRKGLPILARPVGRVEWVWRWMRRHPFPASLMTALVLVTVVGLILLSRQTYQQGVALRESYFQQAKAERLLAAPGFRLRALDFLHKASERSPSDRVRDEVIGILAKMDFSPDLSAGSEPEGLISSVDWLDGLSEEDEVTSYKQITEEERVLSFHRSGRVALWQSSERRILREWFPTLGQEILAEFIPGELGLLVTGTEKGTVYYKGEELEMDGALPVSVQARFLSVSSTGRYVAIGGGTGLETFDLHEKKLLWKASEENVRCSPCWSHDERSLAVTLGDAKAVIVLNLRKQAVTSQYQMTGWPSDLAFHPNDQLLAVSCDDESLIMLDLVLGRTVSDLDVLATDLSFSEGGNRLWIRTMGDEWKAWKIHEAVGYREWDEQVFAEAITKARIFGVRLSRDEKFLLVMSTEGIEVWNSKRGRRVGSYLVENQRIDARTDAWWLACDSREILIQIPGGLEIVSVDTRGRIGAVKNVRKVPGSSVLDVLPNGSWLAEVLDDDEQKSWEEWPEGNFEEATPLKPEQAKERELLSPLKAFSANKNYQAEVLANGDIQLSGDRELTLILPKPKHTKILQILLSQDGHRLFGIRQDHRVFEWDLKELERELRSLGF